MLLDQRIRALGCHHQKLVAIRYKTTTATRRRPRPPPAGRSSRARRRRPTVRPPAPPRPGPRRRQRPARPRPSRGDPAPAGRGPRRLAHQRPSETPPPGRLRRHAPGHEPVQQLPVQAGLTSSARHALWASLPVDDARAATDRQPPSLRSRKALLGDAPRCRPVAADGTTVHQRWPLGRERQTRGMRLLSEVEDEISTGHGPSSRRRGRRLAGC